MDDILCYCCDQMVNETFHHLFLTCPAAQQVWNFFSRGVEIQCPCNSLKESIYKWWTVEGSSKLKVVLNVVPCFVLWALWKRRNKIKHGESCSIQGEVVEISKNLHSVT